MPRLRSRRARHVELERRIASIWADVLERDRVTAEEDFFELGGNSLHAIRIVTRVEELAGAPLSVRSLLESPTVAGMTANVERALAAGAGA